MGQLVKVMQEGQVTIPPEMRRQAGIEIGGYVEIRLVEGRLVLVPRQLIDKNQTWFWAEEWQTTEREAENDLHVGQAKTFDNLDELIADLDANEAEE